MYGFIDLTGQKFNRLFVLKRVHNNTYKRPMWLCLCDCGENTIVRGSSLVDGRTKSCGCLNRERSKEVNTTHGCSGTKTSQTWKSMIRRGIVVCRRWLKFENFIKDMGKIPEKHQIDRVDNNGNYCKSNCRWVTSKINNRNRRNNCLITHDGKTQCVAAWAEEFSICQVMLGRRISRGWPMGKALTTPVREKKKNG